MRILEERINELRDREGQIRVMILGLGSVGNYLLNYLMSMQDERLTFYVVGRNKEHMTTDVNIARIASQIRGQNRSQVYIESDVDFNSVDRIAQCLKKCQPDIIVNSSRAYAGLKYGSISWNKIRAYGIWVPLAVKYTKNIMEAYEQADAHAIVINTSYSDAVIPWLKSSGRAYPDLGSGNVNHLIPRVQFAVAGWYGINDYWNIDVTFASGHFHDVVISKEGHTEKTEQLIAIKYQNKILDPDMDRIFSMCNIPMPVDAKRNMMNASSNYQLINAILQAVRDRKKVKVHSPGAFGELGGYPVILDGRGEIVRAYIDESVFPMEKMRDKNRESMYLDGIENIKGGTLFYTDELCRKAKTAFGVTLMKEVPFSEIESAAQFLTEEVIEKNIQGDGDMEDVS